MTTKVAPTNGTHKDVAKQDKPTLLNGVKPNVDVKTETPVVKLPTKETAPEKPALTSLEDRFYKLDTLFALRDKHEKLKDSLDKLNKFKLSSDGRSDNIVLLDDKGNKFTTSNPDVLAKVVAWLKDDLTQKIKEVDTQITL